MNWIFWHSLSTLHQAKTGQTPEDASHWAGGLTPHAMRATTDHLKEQP